MSSMFIAGVSYILGAAGMYTIAKRRGIHHAWLAWIPMANMWLLGCISDQYQSIVHGRTTKKRSYLLVVQVLVVLSMAVALVMLNRFAGQLLPREYWYMEDTAQYEAYLDQMLASGLSEQMMQMAAGVTLFTCIAGLLIIVLMVLKLIALYDLFRSCDPESSVMFLILAIFVGDLPIFFCRSRDLGMPVSNPQPFAEPEMLPGQEPWESETD